jgi:signal transduction histidine kinase
MEHIEGVSLDRSEMERLRAEIQQLQQERDQALDLLASLERLGQQPLFWDGTPEKLLDLAAHIRRAFGYKAAAFASWEDATLHWQAVDPPGAQLPACAPSDPAGVVTGMAPPVGTTDRPSIVPGDENWGIVPLVTERQHLGVLALELDEPLTPAWIELWRTLGLQVASVVYAGWLLKQIAVENTRLLEQGQRQVNELALLNEISQASSSLHLNDVLRIVTQRIVQALRVRRCAVFLLDETGTHLTLRAANNPNLVSDSLNLEVSLIDRPHVHEAVKLRRPVEIPDVFADERLRLFWDKAHELDIASQLAVPLISKQRVIGAISVGRGSVAPSFDDEEIRLCQTIAHQAANAIENARLYEEAQRRADRLALVNRVSHDIGAVLDIDLLLWEVVRLIRETLDCYYVAVALIEGDELVFHAGIDYIYRSMPKIRFSLDEEKEGIAGWVARTGRPVMVVNVQQDERYQPLAELPDTRSELAVPLKAPEWTQKGIRGASRVIGVLDLRSTQVGAFSTDDQTLLEALAAQVAVAIESARLFGRVREERATLEAIINGTGDAIIVTDTADRILFFNPAAREAFLADRVPEPGSSFFEVVENQALVDFWGEAPQSGAPQKGSFAREIPLADERTLYASMTLVGGVGKVAVMQDISHLKEADRVKSEFVSTVSHDLRSPLQAIQTSVELLQRLGELNLEQRKEVDLIAAVVRRMSELVQNLLDIGRIEAGIGMEVEPCPIDEIIASAAGSCRALAQKKDLDFTIELPKTLPLVQGNRLRLDQVVSNLVTNAIKFTPRGSVTVSAHTRDAEVVIEVADTGVGIPADAREKLFEKFYRVKSPETRGIPGTGLGLAIVKSIVEGYGGRIELESFPRLGSTFRVTLPVYNDEQERSTSLSL